MRCFCGGKNPCFCNLTFVIYKLKCNKCKKEYIGRTDRRLFVRLSEHINDIIKGRNKALATHKCGHSYTLRILARTENRSDALKIVEGKMISIYKPKINRRQEKRAQTKATEMGSAIRDKANFERNVTVSEEDNGESSEYHIESSDHISSEVAEEVAESEEEWDDESEMMTEAEAGNQIVPSTVKIMFKESNYQYLLKIQANKNRKTFSEEESE